MRRRIDAAKEAISVSVNLSSRQFRDPQLLPKISNALRKYDVPPYYLELELTEGLIMEDTIASIKVLDDLHEMGVRISIDDFGTGYCSLSYLKRFPVDYIKIDRSFIAGLPEDKDDIAIVKAIIALSRSLGTATVAEGVGTEQQTNFLTNEGCDVVQGFLYSPPVCEAEVVNWIREFNRPSL